MTSLAPTAPADLPRTRRDLLASGYQPRTVKAEMQANLTWRLQEGATTLPGIVSAPYRDESSPPFRDGWIVASMPRLASNPIQP